MLSQNGVVVGVKQYDILISTHCSICSIILGAIFDTQNLVLVFAQVNMKECSVLMTKMTKWQSR